jgi:hypothetical protein
MADVKLNLIDHSNDQNNSEIVIFSKNVATSFEETAVAWIVVKNLGQGSHHPFVYPEQTDVAASDSWGNYTPQYAAAPGDAFQMIRMVSGNELQADGKSVSPEEIEIKNHLPTGSINALIYKDGKLFAHKTGIAPGQKAVFQFNPTIYIGVVSQMDQGQVMDAAILSDINTQISLLGITAADIVMTGGGAGANAEPFAFTLANVVYA